MPIHLSEGWRRLGCHVEEFFYGTHMGKSWSAQGLRANKDVNACLLATARTLKAKGRLDLIFAVIYDDVLETETVRALRALGVPLVNYHVDLVGQWYRILRTGRYFDRVACAHRDHWPALERSGIRPYYMPMAANPPEFSVSSGQPRIEFNGVLYLGSPWPHRKDILVTLERKGVPLHIYGHNWIPDSTSRVKSKDHPNAQPLRKGIHDVAHYLLPRLREKEWKGVVRSLQGRLKLPLGNNRGATLFPEGIVMGSYKQGDFLHLVKGAAINLGFTHFVGEPGTVAERRQVRLRDFEVPMAGGFYMTQDCLQLRELFGLDEHVVGWNDPDDLVEKIHYFLQHPAERDRIADSGRQYCLKTHTWAQRFKGLLAELGMKPPPSPE
jgi:hypothetical protein